MIVIIGLIILVAAVVVGVAGVLSNGGSGHALTHGFAVFGYHVTGSTGALFLYGIVVGAVAILGFSLLLAGARRTSRRGDTARRGLKRSRSETAAVSKERDDLIDQREAARADRERGGEVPPPDRERGGGSASPAVTTGCILGRVPVLPVLQSDRHHEGSFRMPDAGACSSWSGSITRCPRPQMCPMCSPLM